MENLERKYFYLILGYIFVVILAITLIHKFIIDPHHVQSDWVTFLQQLPVLIILVVEFVYSEKVIKILAGIAAGGATLIYVFSMVPILGIIAIYAFVPAGAVVLIVYFANVLVERKYSINKLAAWLYCVAQFVSYNVEKFDLDSMRYMRLINYWVLAVLAVYFIWFSTRIKFQEPGWRQSS